MSSRCQSIFILGLIISISLHINLANANSPNYMGQAVGQAASSIAGLPSVQTGGDPCNEVIQVIQGSGTVEKYINQGFGTDFQAVGVSSSDCTVLVTFVPVIGSYDSLITTAQQYNASNSTSADNFYVQSFVFAADVTIVDGALYKAAFRSTGELNDALKLGKLRELCGDTCYSAALSSIYWFLKDTSSQELNNFMSWAGGQFIISPQPNVPSPTTIPSQSTTSPSGACSWPIIGWILSLLGSC